IAVLGDLEGAENAEIEMTAADEREAVGVMHVGAAGEQGDILLAGIDQPAVDLVRLRRRAHAEHTILGLDDYFAVRRQVIGDQHWYADAEIDIKAFRDVVRRAGR